jgi:hypothetical protein
MKNKKNITYFFIIIIIAILLLSVVFFIHSMNFDEGLSEPYPSLFPKYVGCYRNDNPSSVTNSIKNDKIKTFNDCKDYATQNNKKYFSFINYAQDQGPVCCIGDTYNSSKPLYGACQSFDKRGHYSGRKNQWEEAVYENDDSYIILDSNNKGYCRNKSYTNINPNDNDGGSNVPDISVCKSNCDKDDKCTAFDYALVSGKNCYLWYYKPNDYQAITGSDVNTGCYVKNVKSVDTYIQHILKD